MFWLLKVALTAVIFRLVNKIMDNDMGIFSLGV